MSLFLVYHHHHIPYLSGISLFERAMALFGSAFCRAWGIDDLEFPAGVRVANVPQAASLYEVHSKVDESTFVGYRKLDLTRKASCLGSSAMDDDEPPTKRRTAREANWGQEVRRKDDDERHQARLNVTYRNLANLAFVPEEKLFSLAIFKGIRGPKFRKAHKYHGKPENLSSPWEAHYQTSERYEEDLSLLLQDFEAKAKHQFALKKKWPKEAELAALFLTWKLRGKEWRKVKTNGTYLQNLDNAWRAKINNFHEEKVFQVVWEYVTRMTRIWDKDRHALSYRVYSGILLKPLPSMQRKQRFIDVDEWTRVKAHTGVDVDRWPKRRPCPHLYETYRR